MNIFWLSRNPEKAAEYHVDKHVTKMTVEAAQIMSTALYLNDYCDPNLYKPTHIHHPCVLWAAASRSNFLELADLATALAIEFSYRFKNFIKSESVIERAIRFASYIPDKPSTKKPLCMPADCFRTDVIESYRLYYMRYKSHLAVWKHRSIPHWWVFKDV